MSHFPDSVESGKEEKSLPTKMQKGKEYDHFSMRICEDG